MKKIRVIHFVQDDKFIDGPFNSFEKDGRFENKAVMIVKNANYKIKRIKDAGRINLIYTRQMLKSLLENNDYDAIFFYSLLNFKVFNYIPEDKIIIWWSWGYDLYGKERFIDIPFYKPLTKLAFKKNSSSFKYHIKNILLNIPSILTIRNGNKKVAIKRIDYFQPVIHTEYELMTMVPGFRAKEFYYPNCMNWSTFLLQDSICHKGCVLIGNSASYTNNHLDVWMRVESYIPKGTTIILPVNYGDTQYASYLESTIFSNTLNVKFLKDFLPLNEYYDIVDSCSFAVFGVLRQQAMGNIYRCIAKGVKLFLYRDSVIYKYLIDLGCIVFAIEDIDMNSFTSPLTPEQTSDNLRCLEKISSFMETVREEAISEIEKVVFKN